MVEIKSSLKYHREAPRKIRLVAGLVKKNTNIIDAKNQLKFSPKKAARTLLSVLNSAVANAKHNYNLEEGDLKIREIIINEGPKLKRWRPVAMGSAHPIEKKTSHITVVLEGALVKKKKVKLGKKSEEIQPKKERAIDKIPEKDRGPERVKEKAEEKKKTPFWQRQRERIFKKEAPKRKFFQRKSI